MTEVNPEILRFVRYLSFRQDTAREKQENPIKLNVETCENHISELERMKLERTKELEEAMPKTTVEHTRPVRYRLKSGGLGKQGIKWDEKCEEFGQPKGCTRFLEYKNGNPNSTEQVKDWLFSLGWKPKTLKYTKNKMTGEEKRIPQVRKDSLLCDSVKDLIEKDPSIEKLDGLTVINHRLGVLKGFLKNEQDGFVVARSNGFTNTLRLKHAAPVVNLPGVEAQYGKWCREVLVADTGRVMVGADVSSLEDTLKQHFIYPHDPDYVNSMRTEGYDPHLSLAIDAGRITEDDYNYYTTCTDHSEDRFKRIHAIRKPMKTVNYACQYSVGAKTLSRNSGMSVKEAQELIDVYWRKNWAVNKVAQEQYVKTLKDGSMQLKNPINGYYYSLRYEKDIFSTLVQGSGDYCFNLWLMFCRKRGLKIQLDYHDEWLASVPKSQEEVVKRIAQESMDKVNETLKLNTTLKMDVQVGGNYAECH